MVRWPVTCSSHLTQSSIVWALSAVEAGRGCLNSHGLGAEGGDSTAGRRRVEKNRSGTGPGAWLETYSDRSTSIVYSSTDRL